MKPIFIIEHLEKKLWPWCLIEYENISKITKKRVWFTNIKSKSDAKKLSKYGLVYRESVKDLKLENACVLDPEAHTLLTPKDSKRFHYFIFGGILGDYPPKKRTKKELTKFVRYAKAKNIGKDQFSTDNAVYVVNQIINNKKSLKNMKFIDQAEIKINKIESVVLPFKYPLVNGNPQMSPKIISYLKKKKGF